MSALAVPLAALAFCTWAVYLGGLAALQSDCDATTLTGLQITYRLALPCAKIYRFWWFVMSWEFVIIVALAVAGVSKKLPALRTALVGLFSIGTILFINASNEFLNAQSSNFFTNGQPLNRIRTVTAGAIMTAVVNAVVVLAVGQTEATAPAAASKDAAAV